MTTILSNDHPAAPAVSVIIPTYRHQAHILDTLESVHAQTFSDYEVIVVNDGSPDDTHEVLRPLVEVGKIRYMEQENAGQAAARNRGIAEARGEFIALLDDDDLWPADKLEWQVPALQQHPEAVLVYGYFDTFGRASSERHPETAAIAVQGDVLRSFRRGNYIGSPGQCLIRASALRAIRGFDAELWGVDDWDLYIRLANCGPFLYHHRCALQYRVHEQNASRNVQRMYRNALRLQQKHFGAVPPPGSWSDWWANDRWIRRHFGSHCRQNAAFLMNAGKNREACKELMQILRIDPLYFRHIGFLRWVLRTALSRS